MHLTLCVSIPSPTSSSADDIFNRDCILEWLIDESNRELDDEIEEVNLAMLNAFLRDSDTLAVMFYSKIEMQWMQTYKYVESEW